MWALSHSSKAVRLTSSLLPTCAAGNGFVGRCTQSRIVRTDTEAYCVRARTSSHSRSSAFIELVCASITLSALALSHVPKTGVCGTHNSTCLAHAGSMSYASSQRGDFGTPRVGRAAAGKLRAAIAETWFILKPSRVEPNVYRPLLALAHFANDDLIHTCRLARVAFWDVQEEHDVRMAGDVTRILQV